MPDKAAALRRQLHDERASVNAAMPTPNQEFRPATTTPGPKAKK